MEWTDIAIYSIITIIALGILASGIKIIRPTGRAVVERLGKYRRFKASGITWVIPFIEKMYMINITEQMTEIDKQEIITKDNLNAIVSAQIYHKVREDEENLKNAFYKVYNVNVQIISLAQTTMRNVIGGKDFADVNSKRNDLNDEIKQSISQQVQNWGIDVIRVELKEIEPPKSVQETMNNVIMAQNKKQAAKDLAEAVATEADGKKNAAIRTAEGEKQAAVLTAEGQAEAIKKVAEAEAKKIELINTAIRENFKDSALLYRQYEVNENALQKNTKIIFTQAGMSPVIVVGGKDEIVPIPPEQISKVMKSAINY